MIKRLIGVGAALAISTMPMFANYITSTLTGFNGGENGGEFFSVTSANGSFYTFCIEKGEHFYPGRTYVYELNSAAVLGSGNHDLTTPGMDILSQGGAYLFAEFTKGTLPGYAADRYNRAGDLQKALWALEDELTYTEAGGDLNPYISLVEDLYGTFLMAQANYTGTEVQVVNVFDDPANPDGLAGRYRQDLLIMVPDGGSTLLLLGLSLIAIRFFSRKQLVTN